MFKKAPVRGSKKRKKKTTNTKSFVSKPRKQREYKPKNVLPDAFYKSSRHGYSWCDDCNGMEINALVGLELTCKKGHTKMLTSQKEIGEEINKASKEEIDVIKLGNKHQQITLLMI